MKNMKNRPKNITPPPPEKPLWLQSIKAQEPDPKM